MPFQKYPNLATDGPNPFENLSEKLNQNRVDFFDGFLMGDFASGRKTDQTAGRSLADTLRVSQTKTDLDVSLNSQFGRMKKYKSQITKYFHRYSSYTDNLISDGISVKVIFA